MNIEKSVTLLPNRTVWVMQTPNCFDGDYTLLISKVSEAILPETVGNHVGEGASMDVFLQHQKDTRFIINGVDELQDIGVQLGLEQFLNLDGGGSSQFRYWDGERWMGNAVDEKDQHRVLGHVLVLFDQQLRPKTNDR